MGTLENVGDAEEERLAGDRADELHAYRQTFRGEIAGDREGRKSAEIGGTIRTEKQGARGMIRARD